MGIPIIMYLDRGGVTGKRCSAGISHFPDLFCIAIRTVSWNPFICGNWDLAISFTARICESLSQLPLIMLNLSWKVRCNLFCQYLTARRSHRSSDFLTSHTLFFSLTFSFFSQLCTLSFTSTFISSLNSTHVPKTLLALTPFPSLVINLSTVAGADESVLRNFILDSELLADETQTFASDFRFLPRLNRNNCLGLLAMSEIGDLIGMDADGRETLSLTLISSECSKVTLGFPTKLMSLSFTIVWLKLFGFWTSSSLALFLLEWGSYSLALLLSKSLNVTLYGFPTPFFPVSLPFSSKYRMVSLV